MIFQFPCCEFQRKNSWNENASEITEKRHEKHENSIHRKQDILLKRMIHFRIVRETESHNGIEFHRMFEQNRVCVLSFQAQCPLHHWSYWCLSSLISIFMGICCHLIINQATAQTHVPNKLHGRKIGRHKQKQQQQQHEFIRIHFSIHQP